MKTASMTLVACTFFCSVTARDLTWTGAQSSVWDLTTANWTDNGVVTTFTAGDNAILSDGAGVAQKDITFGAAVNPASVAVDVTDSFIWRYSNNPFAQTKSIVKTGGGALGIYKDSSDSKFTGLLDIKAGRVETSMPNQLSGFGACTVLVRSGAELRTLDRITLGSPQYGSFVHVRLAGKLALYNSSGSNSHGANSVKTLSLEGGTIEVNCAGSSGSQGFNGVFMVHDAIYATNGPAQTLELINNTSYGNCGLILGPDKPLEFCVADLSGDSGPDLTVQGKISRLNPLLKAGTVGFTKTGPGTMLWNAAQDANNYPNGTISVREGTLKFAPIQNLLKSFTNQTVYVSTNATLQFTFRNAMLPQTCFGAGEHCKTSFHIDHGSLIFGAPDEELGNNPLWGHNFAGRELILDHATFVNHLQGAGTSTNSYGLMTFGELVSLKGDTPYVIGTTHADSVRRFNLFHEKPTEFRIDDIAEGVDVTFDGGFCDHYDIRSETCSASGFVKTGLGTMCLSGQNGTFTGNAEIREGEVILDHENYSSTWFGSGTKSYLGNMNMDRTITVWTNATLNLAQRNLFMMMNGNPVTDSFRATIALRGGTLRQAGGGCNAIPNLFVENGTFEHGNGMFSWGCISVAGTVAVRGDRPFALDAIADGSYQTFLLGRTNVVFDVADVTGNPSDDLHMGLALCRPGGDVEATALGYAWGFTKKGAGTMRLAGNTTACRMNGDVAVAEGTLLVDASDTLLGLSRLSVVAGAAVGGTGAATNVTLAAGAGFAGAVGQAAPLTILGDIALPATGFVDIAVPAGTPLSSIRVAAASATGAISGDVSRWQVLINGQVPEQKVFHVGVNGRTVTAGFLMGTMLIFR